MSPWDEIGWFFVPFPRYITCSLSHAGQVCQANMQRSVLILTSSNGTVYVSPDPNLAFAGSPQAQNGMPVSSNNVPTILQQKEIGPVEQLDWYWAVPAGGTMASILTVVEVILRAWPSNVEGVSNETFASRLRQSTDVDSGPSLARSVAEALRSKIIPAGWRDVYNLQRANGKR